MASLGPSSERCKDRLKIFSETADGRVRDYSWLSSIV